MFLSCSFPFSFAIHGKRRTKLFLRSFSCLQVSFAVVGSIHKSKFSTATAILLLYFTVIAVLAVCVIFFIKWWVALILAVITLPIPLLAILLLYSKKTVLVFDNEKSDYVDYKTRQSLNENAPEKEEELPEIKSFK